jgi:hypothetical protein
MCYRYDNGIENLKQYEIPQWKTASVERFTYVLLLVISFFASWRCFAVAALLRRSLRSRLLHSRHVHVEKEGRLNCVYK